MKRAQTFCLQTVRGFTLIEIMIVVAIIGMLAGIATASFIKARTQTQTNICINNLIRIDMAKEQFAFEVNLAVGEPVVDGSVNTYIKGGNTPMCPANGTYTYNTLGSNPVCSISSHALSSSSASSGGSSTPPRTITPSTTPATPPSGRAVM